MHDPLLVREGQGAPQLGEDAHGVLDREPSLAPQAVSQRLPLDVGRDEVEEPPIGPGGEDGEDVRVLPEDGRHLELAPESGGEHLARELGGQQLDDHGTAEGDFLREVDATHTTAAELALDAVSASDGSLDALLQLAHGGEGGWRTTRKLTGGPDPAMPKRGRGSGSGTRAP